MPITVFDRAAQSIAGMTPLRSLGRVCAVAGAGVTVGGLPADVRLGDRLVIRSKDRAVLAEIVRLISDDVIAFAEGSVEGISIGNPVELMPQVNFAPDDSWIGRVVDPDGNPLDGKPLLPGLKPRSVRGAPPQAYGRRPLGARLETGLAVLNTMLPLVRGQRIGLFSGSGVGKSTLLATLAQRVDADVIVIGLVGERGRELREFVDRVLGPKGMARSVIVTATSDRAPQVRRRCALAATAVAEHFREQGMQVLLLIDSVTRFAEAHRELSAASGEPAALRGFPANTPASIAALCERAGPGGGTEGDITAVYSVLVQGSDMEEPVADWLRGVLDGHVILDRAIAERGRFPAIDVLRSVSRSLPDAATESENALIAEARNALGVYDRSELMIQSGLYSSGSDTKIDEAIAVFPALDRFLGSTEAKGIPNSFAALRHLLSTPSRRLT